MADTICWSCKNAVPKLDHKTGRYICGCNWSKYFKPVIGWKAEKCIMPSQHSRKKIISYVVNECPEYIKG